MMFCLIVEMIICLIIDMKFCLIVDMFCLIVDMFCLLVDMMSCLLVDMMFCLIANMKICLTVGMMCVWLVGQTAGPGGSNYLHSVLDVLHSIIQLFLFLHHHVRLCASNIVLAMTGTYSRYYLITRQKCVQGIHTIRHSYVPKNVNKCFPEFSPLRIHVNYEFT